MSKINAVTSYKLNPENAKQVGTSQRITEKGAYVGQFTRAEAVVSESGTQGIEFSFKSPDGSADYLTLWTVNSDGKEIYGRKVLDAIMTVLRVRGIEAKQGRIQKWDRDQQREVPVEAVLFPDLMNKDVGLILVAEEYTKTNSNETGWKMVIVGAFDAKTNQLPREVLENKQAESLAKVVEGLQDRPLKKRTRPANGGGHGGNSGYGRDSGRSSGRDTSTGFDDMDDDIPF